MKIAWLLRSAVILSGGVLAYQAVCDALDRDIRDASLCGALTVICGAIVALTDL